MVKSHFYSGDGVVMFLFYFNVYMLLGTITNSSVVMWYAIVLFVSLSPFLVLQKKQTKQKIQILYKNNSANDLSLVVTETTTPVNVVTIAPTASSTAAPPVVDSAGGGGGSSSNCRSDEFQCDDGSCVGRHFRCDNVPDCSDASDEDNCSRFSLLFCFVFCFFFFF